MSNFESENFINSYFENTKNEYIMKRINNTRNILNKINSYVYTDEQIQYLLNEIMSFNQSGKNNIGKKFESILSELFKKHDLIFHEQYLSLSNIKIESDFIFPIKANKYVCLSVKTSLKERWSESVKELNYESVDSVYLYTRDKLTTIKENNILKTGLKIVKNIDWFIDLIKKLQNKNSSVYTCVDLFCGMGGFTSGFDKTKIKTICGIDNDKYAIESFKANNENANCIFEDIVNVNEEKIPDSDIIVGGFPCVAFSMAGKRDIDDARGHLYHEFVRIVKHKQPKIFMFENVKGLLSMKNKKNNLVINDIIKDFSDCGYQVKYKLYNCANIGVPQKRERIICVGINKKYDYSFVFPEEPNIRVSAWDFLEPKENVDKSYYHSETMINGFKKRKEENMKNGKGFGYQFLKPNEPAYTISSRYYKDGADCLVIYNETEWRKLTILECKRIQSFPDDYMICGGKIAQYKQLGNAVPYLLSKLIYSSLIECLNSLNNETVSVSENTYVNNTNEESESEKIDKLSLMNFTKEEMVKLCKSKNIKNYSKLKKQELYELLVNKLF